VLSAQHRKVSFLFTELARSEPWFEPGLSLVAEVAGSIVGHCLVSVCRVESTESAPVGSVLALGPIAVAPEHQGRGIGGALVRAVHAVARARDFPAVVLLGHPGYYPRFGYVPARPLGLEAPAPWPDEAWQAFTLTPPDHIPRGIVRYPGAFEPL
jgi:putative acetyltransferase